LKNKKTKYQEYWKTNIYNNKYEEREAGKVLVVMVILFCIIMVMNYFTM